MRKLDSRTGFVGFLRRQNLALCGAFVVALSGLAAAALAGRANDGPGPESRLAARSCPRPYSASSPWNVPIPRQAAVDRRSQTYVGNLGDRLSSDPTQYTYPVYEVGRSTTRESVLLSGLYSNVVRGGRGLVREQDARIALPIPAAARAAAGSDASIVILDRSTGDEWGIWQLSGGSGGWRGRNGYHYNTRWSAVPPAGFGSRGAGVPYLAGLVRPCEIARGRIDHALAFAYDFPTGDFVYPATKSDGKGAVGADVPEGARLQLDPGLTARELQASGCRGACLTIARALQRYGMYVIDNSGRPKIMLEYEGTARWNGAVSSRTVAPIRLSWFRALTLTCVVPPVNGRPVAVAQTLVRLAHCGTARVRRVRSAASRGRVVAQRPAPGTRSGPVVLSVSR